MIVSVAVFAVPLSVADIVAVVFDVTEAALAVNVAVVLPAGIVTVAGTVAADVLDSVITSPPAGAAEPIVTVPVLDLPEATVAGLSVSDFSVGAVIVSVAVFDTLPRVAVKVAAVLVATATVLTVNVPEVFPAATTTDATTVAEFELLDNFTVIPPVGAAPLSVTVPVDEPPPVTAVGLRLTDKRFAGLTVKLAVFETAPLLAVMVGTFWAVTPVVFTVNLTAF